MRLVVTNDDGIDSPGLHTLATALHQAGHEVLVIAPLRDQSGSGASLFVREDQPITVRREVIGEPPGVQAIGIDGTPGLAVLLARLGTFGPPPRCVVAGINAGANTGRGILHSGTVGAALTAAQLSMSGLAVSVHAKRPRHLDTAARLACAAVAWLETARKRTVLNLNVPDLPLAELHGVRWGRLAAVGGGDSTLRVGRIADDHLILQSTLRERDPGLVDPDTDIGLVTAGFAVATQVRGIDVVADTDAADGIARLLDESDLEG